MNESKLEKQLQRALVNSKGFKHNSYKVTDKDVQILKNKYNNKINKKGGFIPLIPLFAGLSALGALSSGAAGIAKAINDAKHNKNMEEIAKEKEGQGIYLAPYEGKGIKDFISNIIKKSNIEQISKDAVHQVLKNIAENGATAEVSGSGLFLAPYHK